MNFPRALTLACSIAACVSIGAAPSHAATVPAPAMDEARASAPSKETIVLAGGCFWGMQDVFDHVKGVAQVTAGYAGGKPDSAAYEKVSTGTTGHAEAVQVSYDPSQVTLGQLLQVYFSVAHNPTELNRQGPDSGSQYRSAIFTSTPEQQKIAADYIRQLDTAKSFNKPVVTEIAPLQGFYAAESYHQGYAKAHPLNPYIAINDAPKVADLQQQFPDMYKAN